MKAFKIMEYLESYFPLEKQLEWDRCGIQIGNKDQEIKKIMVALNADQISLDAAIAQNCDMLLTHHPFFLENIQNLNFDGIHGTFVEKAIKHHVLVYSLHTCLDIGTTNVSMNDWLIDTIGVTNKKSYDDNEVGKCGTLKQPMKVEEFVLYLKQVLPVHTIRYTKSDKLIRHIAICGGSGAEDLNHLLNKVDCFITGDTKYRHAKMAMDHDIVLIDVGHHVEVIMEQKVKELLSKYDIEVVTLDSEDYYQYK